ncbi:hypothetical protein PAPHI01_1557 [Pancytospora philotis]|nr:hypothetical protein PAPHI01_1557 [Pancytospora philotis]
MLLPICHMLMMLVHGRPGNGLGTAAKSSNSPWATVRSFKAEEMFTPNEAELLKWLFARDFMIRFREESIDGGLRLAGQYDLRKYAVNIIVGALRKGTDAKILEHLVSLVMGYDLELSEMGPLFKLLSKLFTRDYIEFARADPDYIDCRGNEPQKVNLYKMDLDSCLIRQIHQELKDLAEQFSAISCASHPLASDTASTS